MSVYARSKSDWIMKTHPILALKQFFWVWIIVALSGAGSTEAASTWRAIADSRPFNAVWMANATEGWAVSTGGGVSQTVDGGDTWTEVPSGVTVTLRGVWGSAANDVWAVGDGGTVIRWNGTSWATVVVTGVTENLQAIHGAAAGSIWAVGLNATIIRWDGTAWAVQDAPNGVTDDLYGVWAAGNGTAMAVGERGRGLRYNGTTWVNNATGAGNGVIMRAVWGTGANSLWAVGTGGEIRFWNGSTWVSQASGTAEDLWAVNGAGASQVWAAGTAGELRFFNGTSWSAQDSDTNQNLQALEVVSGSKALAVGNRRAVCQWDGTEWTAEVAPLLNVAFPAIWAADDDRVWFGGGNGLIVRWTGTGFVNTPTGTNRAINAMWGLDHSNIWAVGANGTILKWDGTAWSVQTSGTTEALNGVWGTSANQVWAVGADGTILRWNGTAWSKVNSGTTQSLNAVWARDANNAWAVGQRGTILKWSGSSWAAQTSGVVRNMLSVWGAGTSVWAGGAAGTILKLSGTTWSAQTSGVTGGVAALTGTSTTAVWAGAGAAVLGGNGSTWSPDGSTGVGLNVAGIFALSPAAIFVSTNSGMLFTNLPLQAPQITVERSGQGLNTGEGAADFGAVEVTQSAPITFTIRNTGTTDLEGLALGKDGAHAGDYTLGNLAELDLAPGEFTDFTVTFAPSAKGVRTANVRITSNDPTEPSFLIRVTGSGFYEPVAITQEPQNVAAALGGPVQFNVSATGTEVLKYQWRRNGASIKGATSATFSLPSVTTSNAGTYSVVVSNPSGSKTSANALLVVADTAPKTVALPTGGTFRSTAPVSGTVTGYLWRQGMSSIPNDPRYTGWAGKTLQITRLVETDAANYFCDMTTAGGPLTTETRLIVYNDKPVILTPGPTADDPIVMPEAIVSGAYAPWPVPIDASPLLTPTSFSASGLPKGLVINKTTGVVSGVPSVALTAVKDYAVVFTASNAKGKMTAKATLKLHPLPANTIGTYTGPVVRTAGFYSGLGGRVDLSVTSTGAYSGKVLLAGTTLSFKGVLSASLASVESTATAVIKRSKLTDLLVSFTVDPANQRLKSAQLNDGTFVSAFAAWRNLWALPEGAALQAFVGQFNTALRTPVADSAVHPQGAGFASFKVAANGKLTVSGMLPDATAFTCATYVGPLGEILVYRNLYSSKGSISGHMMASAGTAGSMPAFSDSGLAGTLQWSRPAQNSRTYRNGFGPIDLTPAGGRYLAPDKFTPPMDLADGGPGTTNAALAFSEGGIADTVNSPGILVRVQAGGKVELPAAPGNPQATKLTVTSSTGATSGSFRLLDQNPAVPGTNVTRTSSFRGLLVREAGVMKSYGYFLLAKRPAAMSTEKPTTTDILSGLMTLTSTP